MNAPATRDTVGVISRFARGALVVLMLAAVLGASSVASAHAIVVSISPANGEVVDEAPATIVVTFTEPVTVREGAVTILDDTGADVPAAVEVAGVELRLTPDATLREGTYVMSWRIVSADSHLVGGGTVFHVGSVTLDDVTVAVDEPPPGVGVVRSAADALMYAAALLALGAGLFAARWSSTRVARVARRSALVALGALAVGLGCRVAEIEAAWGGVVDGQAWRRTLEGPVGWMSVLVGAGLVVVVTASSSLARLRSGAWVPGAALVVVGLVVEGHTRSAEPGWVAIVADVVHLMAAGLWLGGVAALWLVRREASAFERRTRAVDVSNVAVVAVAVVVVAGIAMTATIGDGFEAVVSTRWGAALLTKVAAVAALVTLGWYNRFRLVPRLGPADDTPVASEQTDTTVRRLGRTLRAELVLFAVVLAATGVLVSSPPVVDADGVTSTPSETAIGGRAALDSGVGTLQYVLAPGERGVNELTFTLIDDAGDRLELLFDPVVEVTAPELGIGPVVIRPSELAGQTFTVSVDLPIAARWVIAVQARTGTFETGRAAFEVDVE